MTDKEYNRLIELRNNCYRDRVDRETEINYFTGFNDGYEKGRETLEKENAELKNRNQELLESCEGATMMYEHLTKAKDHIKRLLDCLRQDTNDPQTNHYVVKYMIEAEQFLSEVKK